MRKNRHPVVLTVAILQVVFGVMALACDGFGVINAVGLQAMSNSPVPTQPSPKGDGPGQPKSVNEQFNQGYMVGKIAQVTIIQNAPGYLPVQYGRAFFGMLLGVLMLLSGIGLFFMQSWARWSAVGYGVLSLVARCAFVVYHAVVVLPILMELGDGFAKSGHPEWIGGLVGLKFMPFVGLLLGLYPLVVIVLLLLPPVGKAFHGEPSPDVDFNDYRDHFPASREDDRFR